VVRLGFEQTLLEAWDFVKLIEGESDQVKNSPAQTPKGQAKT
jgi:hypothetical protein